jgi:hypothetical protein
MADPEGAKRLKHHLQIALAMLPGDPDGTRWSWTRLALEAGVTDYLR